MTQHQVEDIKWSEEIRQIIGEVTITMGIEKGQHLANCIKHQASQIIADTA